MKCLNCNKKLDNLRAKYCSDKCRMAYARRTNDPNKLPEQPEQIDPNTTRTEQPEQTILNNPNKMSAKELYDAIDLYPNDTWKDSIEFIELKRRLNNWNLDKLKEEKFWIPLRVKTKYESKKTKKD